MDRDPLTPVENLVGATLENGWTVDDKIDPDEGYSGGHFSAGYISHDEKGKEYFLKAIDFSKALADEVDDPVVKINALTQAYLHEKGLLEECRGKKLSRVVRYIDAGYLTPKNEIPEKYILLKRVPYLLFQMGQGGLRSELTQLQNLSRDIDFALLMRALHNVAAGLNQLHQLEIAHRDLKPSNVINFGGEGYKIADLGCAKKANRPAPRDHYTAPGDRTYMPLEYYYSLYNARTTQGDWHLREISTDYYTLGGLAYCMLTYVPLTSSILSKVHPQNKYPLFRGFYNDVLEYLVDAWDSTLSEFRKDLTGYHPDFVSLLVSTIAELTHPNPSQRGYPKATSVHSQFMMGRYVTKFDLLARRAELHLISTN